MTGVKLWQVNQSSSTAGRRVQWWFENAKNRDAFASEPEKYAPAVGDYCTFGIVLGKKLVGDPQIWLRENEQLYVFLNRRLLHQILRRLR